MLAALQVVYLLCYYWGVNKQKNALWFRAVATILIGFGILYTFVGLRLFSEPGIGLIPKDVILNWESALYGAIMIGWGVTLLLVGRIAFKQQSGELKQALFIGLAAWLAVEALASAWFGVWFNVGVDVAVLALFAVPLLNKKDTVNK
jgi:hypothetical protein